MLNLALNEWDNVAPVPYDEDKDPDKFWKPDLYEHILPKQRGFITDMVYFMRGMEVPIMYAVWSGLWLLSTVIKREAWLKWYPDDMYANLYVILAGPAATKKSTTIDAVGLPIIDQFGQYFTNENLQGMKNINIVKDKMTPEALLDAMLPGNKPGKVAFRLTDGNGNYLLNPDGTYRRYKATSETGIMLSEMSSSIGKKSYTEGFIEVLLDLYNPAEKKEMRTKGGGLKVLQKTYLTMLAATTPASFKESIPKVATGDGFLSRCVIAYVAKNNRCFPIPRKVENGPSLGELARRLAWISENTMGEFVLASDAFARYEQWYRNYKEYMASSTFDQGVKGRMDINLLKVALLLRANRYDQALGKIITLADMEDAISLVEMTYATSQELLSDLDDGIISRGERLLQIIKRHKKLSRPDLLKRGRMPASEINEVLDFLRQSGQIVIWNEGKERLFPSKSGNEYYEFVPEDTDEEEREEEETAPESLNQ